MRPSMAIPAPGIFAAGYNGGWRCCGELYRANTGLVVKHISPYGLVGENVDVGDSDGAVVICGV